MVPRCALPLRLAALLGWVLTVSCGPSVQYVPLAPAGPAKGLADPIEVYADDVRIPHGAAVVGEVRVGDTGFSTGCGLNALISILKDKARAVGADAVYLARIVEPDLSSTCYRVTARLLKYPESQPVSEAAPPRATAPSFAPIKWRRATPSLSEIVELSAADRNPSPKTDKFERAADAVVRLRSSRGGGTGFLITRDGLALTNHHVVEDQNALQGTLRDGRRLSVRVLRSDAGADVALVQIDCATDCFTLDLATANPKVGKDVYVIGNPLELDYTLTRGVVSGLRLAGGITLLQTDAALNPGNSGGPILDAETGQVLGIVSWKVTGARAEGLGFGVAAPDAARVLGIQHQQ